MTAFGADAMRNPSKINRLRDAVEAMKATNMKVKSVIPEEGSGEAGSVPETGANNVKDNKVQYSHLELGNRFFDPGYGLKNRAATLVHETNHYSYGGEDDVVGGSGILKDTTMANGIKADTKEDRSDHTIAMKTPENGLEVKWEKGGCT